MQDHLMEGQIFRGIMLLGDFFSRAIASQTLISGFEMTEPGADQVITGP